MTTRILIAILFILTTLALRAQEVRIDTMYFEIEDVNPVDPSKKTKAGFSTYESGCYDRRRRTEKDRRREYVKLWVSVNGEMRLLFNDTYLKENCLLGYTEYSPLVARAAYNDCDSLLYVFIQWDQHFDIYKIKLDGSTVYRYPFSGYSDDPEFQERISKWYADTHLYFCNKMNLYCHLRYTRFVDADMSISDNILKMRCYLWGYKHEVFDISYDFATQEWTVPDAVQDPYKGLFDE